MYTYMYAYTYTYTYTYTYIYIYIYTYAHTCGRIPGPAEDICKRAPAQRSAPASSIV